MRDLDIVFLIMFIAVNIILCVFVVKVDKRADLLEQQQNHSHRLIANLESEIRQLKQAVNYDSLVADVGNDSITVYVKWDTTGLGSLKAIYPVGGVVLGLEPQNINTVEWKDSSQKNNLQ